MASLNLDREIDNKKKEVEYLTMMLENAKRDLRTLEWKKKNNPEHKEGKA